MNSKRREQSLSTRVLNLLSSMDAHLESVWRHPWPSLQLKRLCRRPTQVPDPLNGGLRSLEPCGDDRPLLEAAPGAMTAHSAKAACQAGAADQVA